MSLFVGAACCCSLLHVIVVCGGVFFYIKNVVVVVCFCSVCVCRWLLLPMVAWYFVRCVVSVCWRACWSM